MEVRDMWNGINRRKFPRAHRGCTLHIGKNDSEKTISTTTENIGEGGICVVLKEDLGLFQGLNLELKLNDGNPSNIFCSGTVVWVIKKRTPEKAHEMCYDIGIEFVDLNEENKQRISKVVDHYSEEQELK
jgi:Tfp pilus assembly protein PilZ